MASKKSRKASPRDDEDGERAEARVFFRTVHEIRASSARVAARQAAETFDRPEAELRTLFLEAIGAAFFQLFATIDRTGGPDDFPSVELTLEDGESLNGNFLHDLYVEYEPEERAQALEKVRRKRPAEKHAVVVNDEKQALGLLNAFARMPGLNVAVHGTYSKTIPAMGGETRRKKR